MRPPRILSSRRPPVSHGCVTSTIAGACPAAICPRTRSDPGRLSRGHCVADLVSGPDWSCVTDQLRYAPDGFISRWNSRPTCCLPFGSWKTGSPPSVAAPLPVPAAVPVPPPPPPPPPTPVVLDTVCGAVLKLADVAAPAPSKTTVTGLLRPKFWQPRLVKDMLSRLAMKVNRSSP